VAFARQHGDRSPRIIGTCGRRDPAASRAADEGTSGHRATDGLGVVLGVPAVARDRGRNALCLQVGFGGAVLVRERSQGRGVGSKQARVDDPLHARSVGCLNDVAVLDSPLTHLVRGDEQQGVHPGERLVDDLRLGVVGLPDGDAGVGGLRRGAPAR
jgi:hypothetical protein